MGCAFNSRKCVIFLVSWSLRCAHVLLGRKTSDEKKLSNRFLYKKIFSFYDDDVNQLGKLTRGHKRF